jgi:hypothetical protein
MRIPIAPSGCPDVKLDRVASFLGLPRILGPDAGEVAVRRYSSASVKDEGLCHTSGTISSEMMGTRLRASTFGRAPGAFRQRSFAARMRDAHSDCVVGLRHR